MMASAPDRFETLAWVYSQPELAVILSALEHEGVRVLAIGQDHIATQWNWTIALGGVQLRVHAEDAARARARFAGFEPGRIRDGLFSRTRIVDIAIILILFCTIGFAPPARISTEFVGAASVGRRADS